MESDYNVPNVSNLNQVSLGVDNNWGKEIDASDYPVCHCINNIWLFVQGKLLSFLCESEFHKHILCFNSP